MKMIKNRMNILLPIMFCFLAGFLIPGFWLKVYAGVDQTPPVLTGFTMDRNIITQNEFITFNLDIVEEETGVNSVSISFHNPEMSDTFYGNESSVEDENGLWRIPAYTGRHKITTTAVNSSTIPGTYYLDAISLSDKAGHSVTYERNTDENGVFLSCDNEKTKIYEPYPDAYAIKIVNPDYKGAPFIQSCKLISKECTTDGKILVDIEMDSFEPVDIFLWFDSGVGNHWMDDAWNHDGNIYHLEFSPGNFFQSCQTRITGITLRDRELRERKYNVIYNEEGTDYYLEDEINHSKCQLFGEEVLTFTYIEKKTDKVPPRIISARLVNNVVSRPGVINIEFHVSDDRRLRMVSADVQDNGIPFNVNSIDWGENGNKEYSGTIGIPVASSGNQGILGSFEVYFSVDDGENSTTQYVGNVQIKDEFDVVFDSGITNPKLLNSIKNMKNGETGRVEIADYHAGTLEAIFSAMKGRDISIIFYSDFYMWVFNGKDIHNPKDIKLGINMQVVPGEYYGMEGEILELSFPDNGVLPGKAQIRIKADAISNIYNYTGRLYVYYENADSGSIDLVEDSNTQYIIDGSDHWCYFDIDHNSVFLLSGRKISHNAKPVSSVNTNTVLKKGSLYNVSGNIYKITKLGNKTVPGTVTFVTAGNKKNISIPREIKLVDEAVYQVTALGPKAFKAKKIRKVSLGANIKKISKNAFSASKVSKIIVKTKHLKKSNVKNCLKKSKVKTVQVKVGNRKTNKKYKKKYKKIFIRKVVGRKVKVK